MDKNSVDLKIGNQTINLSFGQLAPQANASVVATYGQTVVLSTVVVGALDETKDYFPLSVEFADKLYAGGLIKGGKWIKREGGPSDTAVLFGRIIDRAIRPLFPEGFQNEVQIITTVLSNDKEHELVIPAFLATSAALSLSDIPFNGPVCSVRAGLINNQIVLNPLLSQMASSQMDLLICVDSEGVNMIETSANIVQNDIVFEAISQAYELAKNINQQLEDLKKKYGKTKMSYEAFSPPAELETEIDQIIKPEVTKMLDEGVDGSHVKAEEDILAKVKENYQDKIKNEEVKLSQIVKAVDNIIHRYFRQYTLSGTRFDKRQFDQIRPLYLEAGVLPCAHGSALFQRGLTQALTVTTLGSLADKQYLQDSSGETTKRYIHYYSAMPFSTGQTGRFGRPGRREIGHGALAEKALIPVIPTEQEFPYTITLTSEVLSQNGSSSMASTCGSTLSLMDAGVPIKDKVAGISVGMVSEGSKYILLTDIAGIEDHHGDMDFKITGTRQGITAIQLDIKRMGLTLDMIRDTFTASTKARLFILDQIDKTLESPRPKLSVFAPKIQLVKLPEDKIGEVIGSGGKTVKGLMAKYGVQIDIDDFGNASISCQDQSKVASACYEIESMIKEVQIGEEYDGVVTRVENYGAFVEFLPGREALLHVSELSQGFVTNPADIIKIGDKIHVKISGFNDNHQIKLSAPEFKLAHPGQPRDPNSSPNRPVFNNQRFGRFTAPSSASHGQK